MYSRRDVLTEAEKRQAKNRGIERARREYREEHGLETKEEKERKKREYKRSFLGQLDVAIGYNGDKKKSSSRGSTRSRRPGYSLFSDFQR